MSTLTFTITSSECSILGNISVSDESKFQKLSIHRSVDCLHSNVELGGVEANSTMS